MIDLNQNNLSKKNQRYSMHKLIDNLSLNHFNQTFFFKFYFT